MGAILLTLFFMTGQVAMLRVDTIEQCQLIGARAVAYGENSRFGTKAYDCMDLATNKVVH